MRLWHRVATFCCLALAGIVPGNASAQTYPQRPVTVIVPYAAGGTTDILARMVGQTLGDKLGQSFVIENKPGAGTALGAATVARSEPDGQTLLIATSTTLAINASLFKKLSYDPVADFSPVSLVAAIPLLVVVNPSLPVNSLQDLIALAKSQPGTLSYGSAGTGSPHHLAAELLKTMAGVDIKHVPYKGSAPALTDVVAGHIPLMLTDIAPALPFIENGQLKVLAVTSAKRASAAPSVPTVAEAGIHGYEAVAWQSLVAPAKTPQAIVSRLNSEIAQFLADPINREKLVKLGMEPLGGSPEEFAAYIKTETVKWADVVKKAGISPN
jgi:tripartite-type tricarboxylate transporter receptor subunit TctC